MSKEQLLEEIAKLSPQDRDELLNALWAQHAIDGDGPTEEEKALLDREIEDYERNPEPGTPADIVFARLRSRA